MREYKAYTLKDWPRRKGGELIFSSTNEAIYFATLVENRLEAINLLSKWRKNAYQDIELAKQGTLINYDRLFDLAVREAMEEIQRLIAEAV